MWRSLALKTPAKHLILIFIKKKEFVTTHTLRRFFGQMSENVQGWCSKSVYLYVTLQILAGNAFFFHSCQLVISCLDDPSLHGGCKV